MQEYLVCLIPKYSAQNITSNLAICFWNIADYFGILVILQAIFNRILFGIRGFSCSDCIESSLTFVEYCIKDYCILRMHYRDLQARVLEQLRNKKFNTAQRAMLNFEFLVLERVLVNPKKHEQRLKTCSF